MADIRYRTPARRQTPAADGAVVAAEPDDDGGGDVDSIATELGWWKSPKHPYLGWSQQAGNTSRSQAHYVHRNLIQQQFVSLKQQQI